jgi:hypothetical protein
MYNKFRQFLVILLKILKNDELKCLSMAVRKLTLFVLFLISGFGLAQEAVSPEYLFIRVYNLEGKKIANSPLISVTDNSISLEVKDSVLTIPVAEIGKIRTKHSFGANVLFGAIAGGCLGLALIAGDAETGQSSGYTGEDRVAAVVGGLFLGAAVGLGTGVFKNSKVYQINGDLEALKKFRETLQIIEK